MPGTVTVTHDKLGIIKKVILDVVADDTDGSVPETDLPRISGRILAVETDPGATAPQDNYDIVIDDAHGHDVLEGAGDNRDTADTEKAPVVYGTYFHPPVSLGDVLIFKLTNNNVNSAIVAVSIYYIEG